MKLAEYASATQLRASKSIKGAVFRTDNNILLNIHLRLQIKELNQSKLVIFILVNMQLQYVFIALTAAVGTMASAIPAPENVVKRSDVVSVQLCIDLFHGGLIGYCAVGLHH